MKTHSTAGDDCLEDHPHHMLAVWMTGRCQRTNASQLENIETFQLTKIKLTFWTQSPNSLFSQKCVELWPGRRIRGLLVININFIFIVLQRGTGLNSLSDFAGAAAVTEKFCLIWMGKFAILNFWLLLLLCNWIIFIQWSNTRTQWRGLFNLTSCFIRCYAKCNQHCKKHIRGLSLHLYKSWMV